MDNAELRALCDEWIKEKNLETEAKERRQRVEERLQDILEIDPLKEEALNMIDVDLFFRAETRLNREVNEPLLKVLAVEHDLSEEIKELFNWKPEFDLRRWRNADESLTKRLDRAIRNRPEVVFKIKYDKPLGPEWMKR